MNSKWRMCHPERNAVRREVEGSRPADVCRTSHERSVVAVITCLFALLLSACTDYQAEFEESFGALEYIGEEYVSSDAGHHGGVSGGSDEKTSKSSGSVDLSSTTSSATPTSGGNEQLSSGAASSQSLGEPSSNSTGSSGSTESSNSTESSSSVKKLSSCNVVPYGNCFEDERDGQTYKTTAEISGLVWMAENLNYEAQSSLCYDKSAENCAKYGRLYEIKSYSNYNSTNLCPDGWHVPDSVEWASLFARVGGPEMAGSVLKTTTGWDEGAATSTDDINFSALPGGLASSQNNFEGMPKNAYFMTTSKVPERDYKYVVNLFYSVDDVKFRDDYSESHFVSVRCVQGTLSSSSSVASSSSVKSSSSSAPPSSSSFGSSGVYTDPRSDAGNQQQYQYVRYRGLVWMDQDLSYPVGATLHDGSTLYSWENAQNACPPNWRLPTIEEFNGSDGLEYKFKSSSRGGYFLMTAWHKKGYEGMYWLTTSSSSSDNYLYAVHFNKYREFGTVVRVDKGVVDVSTESAAFAVRCVTEDLEDPKLRSSSSSVLFSKEQVFSNYGDSREYTTVTIGGYKWMAENLRYHADASLTNNATLKCRNSTSQLLNCDEDGIYYSYKNGAERIASLDQQASANGGRWTLPDSSEAAELLKAVGNDAGLLLSPEIGGTNESGFYVVPSGYHKAENGGTTYRYISYQDGETCFWLWTDVGNSENAKALCFFKNGGKGFGYRPKNFLYPIRLIWVPNPQP